MTGILAQRLFLALDGWAGHLSKPGESSFNFKMLNIFVITHISSVPLLSPQRVRRFLVISTHQLVLVEPDSRKLGWGVARFVGLLQVR